MKEHRDILRFWHARRAQPLALATLVAARGSSYRRPGARMLIDSEGASAGGVSAGCIEEEVILHAARVLTTGMPEVLTFDTRLRFGCQGAIDILVEPAADDVLAAWHEHAENRRTFDLETHYHGHPAPRGTRIAMAGSKTAPGAFTQTIEPFLRLVLIGHGSETLALHAHATLLGWEVLHYETAPTSADMFDDRTAVVLATHHFGRDCTALRHLLPRGLKYLGVVGSRRRREDLLFDVMQGGISLDSDLFAPAGLHLGAESPEEIALAMVAEIQCIFSAGTAQQLRHRKSPIHQPLGSSTPCMESAA